MPPKRSTRSTAKAGKDAEPKTQTTLGNDGTIQEDPPAEDLNSKKQTEKKRDADDLINPQEMDKAINQPSLKKQKTEAGRKQKVGDADAVDEASEEAKAAGREIYETGETLKPQRGTLEAGEVHFWYKPKMLANEIVRKCISTKSMSVQRNRGP